VPRVSKRISYVLLPLIAVAIVVLGALVLGADSSTKTKSAGPQAKSCGPYRDDRDVVIDHQTIKAEIPNDPNAQEKGLAGRPCILADQGMLFIFPKDGNYPFWMKGMKFPIDIVWITSHNTVAADEINFKPSTYPERRVNQIPARYVLELKANRSKQLHIKIGTPVTL
jgi:uncharacterized membrane protein (UPF0127 family)